MNRSVRLASSLSLTALLAVGSLASTIVSADAKVKRNHKSLTITRENGSASPQLLDAHYKSQGLVTATKTKAGGHKK